MPNWCGCELLVTGSKKDLDEFAKKAATKKCPLDFNIFIPYPENWRKLDKAAEKARKKGEYNVRDGYNNGGYQWCIANWGTKWVLLGSASSQVKETCFIPSIRRGHHRTQWLKRWRSYSRPWNFT